MLQNSCEDDLIAQSSSNIDALALLKKRLQEIPLDQRTTNDVQVAEFSLTRSWMYTLIWRMTTNCGRSVTDDPSTSIGYPTQVAKDLLDLLSSLPVEAIEVQGTSLVSFKYF